MPVPGEWVWVRRDPGYVWHLARWLGGEFGIRQPPCGMRAPAWIRWMREGEPIGERAELCRGCLLTGAFAEKQERREVRA